MHKCTARPHICYAVKKPEAVAAEKAMAEEGRERGASTGCERRHDGGLAARAGSPGTRTF